MPSHPQHVPPSSAWESGLCEFLVEVFDPEALHDWVECHHRALAAELPGRSASLRELAWRYVEQARREGYVDSGFFQALVRRFPRRVERIRELHDRWMRSDCGSSRSAARGRVPLGISSSLKQHPSSHEDPTLVLHVQNIAGDVGLQDLCVRPEARFDESGGDAVVPVGLIRIHPPAAWIPYLEPRQRVRLEFKLIRLAPSQRELCFEVDLHCRQPFELFTEVPAPCRNVDEAVPSWA